MGATMIGERVKRLEDPRLLVGEASYVDDIQLPNTLHAAILRSPHGNARIRSIDLSAARAAPGVVDAISLADAWPDGGPTIPVLAPVESLLPCPQYLLAKDQVRYVGEPVAVIVAESRDLAEDATELAEVDYEPLPALATMEGAMAAGAEVLHETVPDNVAAKWTQGIGDVAQAFDGAAHVIGDTFRMQRYTGVPMEARGTLATQDPVNGELTVWTSGQWPHTQRALTAALLGLDEKSIRVIQPEVGGGFGVKVELYPEDVLIPFAALRLGCPVKWIEDRREHMLTIVHAREMDIELEVALEADGTIRGMRGRLLSDQGAYFRTLGTVNPSLAVTCMPGPYKIQNYEGEVVCVLTNKSPSSPYRGAGGPEAVYARERLFDIAAREIGMDPAEFRMKNLIQAEDMPYDTGLVSVESTVVFDSGDFPKGLKKALADFDYAGFRSEQERDRNQGKLRGLGICVYTQMASVGPYESAEVRVDSGGKVSVIAGSAPQGQGTGTALAQVVSDQLEVPLEQITVTFADTARIPFGVGTYASRNAVMAGSATLVATQRVRDKAIEVAANLLEASSLDVEWHEGAARLKGVPQKSHTLAELAKAAGPGGNRPEGMEPGLEARYYYETMDAPFAFGVHLAEVEVEPETGHVEITRYVVVNDCGCLINPMIVDGQIVGGIAQGVGGALLEELVYDEDGQMLSANLMDYQLPTSLDLPDVEISHYESPSPLNPLGVKGIGEGGAIAGHAVVANAVEDALAHTGARVLETPLRPAVIWRLMQEGGSAFS